MTVVDVAPAAATYGAQYVDRGLANQGLAVSLFSGCVLVEGRPPPSRNDLPAP